MHKYSWITVFINHKCYISMELTFLKELILIKQLHEKKCDAFNY